MGKHVASVWSGQVEALGRRHMLSFGVAAATSTGAALLFGRPAAAEDAIPVPPSSEPAAPISPAPEYLWADRDADDTFQPVRRRLDFKDIPEAKGSVINIDHRSAGTGNASGQTYGVDIHNYPGAKSALVIHQYSSVERAVTIDNTGSAPAIEINNTQNNVINPGSDGTGDYFMLRDHGAMAMRLDKNLVFRAGGTKVPTFIHTAAKALSVQTAATFNGETMDVTKFGLGAGAALKVNNYGTSPGLHIRQTGAGRGLQVDANQAVNAGQYAAVLQGYDYGLSVTTTGDSGAALVLTKNAGGPGAVQQIVNKGTGNSFETRDAKGQKFSIGATGFISVLHGQNVNIIAGTGSPEGIKNAPVGSIYLRTDGGTGASFYVKEADGTAKTGWVAK